jgi:hypothetical protein
MLSDVLAVGVERSIRFLTIATHDSLHPATVQPPGHGPGIPLATRQDPANEQIAIHLQNQVFDRGDGGR